MTLTLLFFPNIPTCTKETIALITGFISMFPILHFSLKGDKPLKEVVAFQYKFPSHDDSFSYLCFSLVGFFVCLFLIVEVFFFFFRFSKGHPVGVFLFVCLFVCFPKFYFLTKKREHTILYFSLLFPKTNLKLINKMSDGL